MIFFVLTSKTGPQQKHHSSRKNMLNDLLMPLGWIWQQQPAMGCSSPSSSSSVPDTCTVHCSVPVYLHHPWKACFGAFTCRQGGGAHPCARGGGLSDGRTEAIVPGRGGGGRRPALLLRCSHRLIQAQNQKQRRQKEQQQRRWGRGGGGAARGGHGERGSRLKDITDREEPAEAVQEPGPAVGSTVSWRPHPLPRRLVFTVRTEGEKTPRRRLVLRLGVWRRSCVTRRCLTLWRIQTPCFSRPVEAEASGTFWSRGVFSIVYVLLRRLRHFYLAVFLMLFHRKKKIFHFNLFFIYICIRLVIYCFSVLFNKLSNIFRFLLNVPVIGLI